MNPPLFLFDDAAGRFSHEVDFSPISLLFFFFVRHVEKSAKDKRFGAFLETRAEHFSASSFLHPQRFRQSS